MLTDFRFQVLCQVFCDNSKNTFVCDSINATDITGTAVLLLVSAEIWIAIFLVQTGCIFIFVLGYQRVLMGLKSALMSDVKKQNKTPFHPFCLFLPPFLPFTACNVNAT